jgi:3-oxoacyl-[acyl-carrier protein] reductase
MGRPQDISSIVRFLASAEAGFITGETIYVDGGMTRRMPLVR